MRTQHDSDSAATTTVDWRRIKSGIALSPVSYTHLDVYKRQLPR